MLLDCQVLGNRQVQETQSNDCKTCTQNVFFYAVNFIVANGF